ncbi:MAG: SMI1/KNR4 family protein [Lachnospiraceae bacterium]|nr:SMI1/KNR4 family protein [Lachnospiraceae bacterium]
MSPQEEKEFIERAFQKLKERGWFPGQEFEPSTITEQEIAAFEQKHQVTLPSLYKAFLTSYRLPRSDFNSICSVIDRDADGYLSPLWLMIDSPRTMDDVSERMEILQEIRDFCELPEDCFRNLIPIGDWGAGFGPLCIDLSRPEEQADEENEETWSLVWFDHEDFDWDEQYLGEDGLLHGIEAAPGLKVLLEWYFYGSLEDRFEREEGTRPSYEWYQETLKR